MSEFPVLKLEDSDGKAREVMEKAKAGFGFVPNLLGVMAEAPALAEAYLTLSRLMSETSFTAPERHVVWFTINYTHNCHYCMAAHSAGARRDGVDEAVIEAARAGAAQPDPHLEALRVFTEKMVLERGWVSDGDVEAFLAAGFTRRHVLEIVLAIAHKTMSNYTNHLARTPLDEVFQPFAWSKEAATAAE